MRSLLFLFFLLNIFNYDVYTTADILDESEFVKETQNSDNLLNYMNSYYDKMKKCCNDTLSPSPSPSPSPLPSPSPGPFKWRGIVYMEVLDIIENNGPELQIV